MYFSSNLKPFGEVGRPGLCGQMLKLPREDTNYKQNIHASTSNFFINPPLKTYPAFPPFGCVVLFVQITDRLIMSAMMRSVLMFNGNLGNSLWLRALGGPVGRCVSVMLNKNIYTEVRADVFDGRPGRNGRRKKHLSRCRSL